MKEYYGLIWVLVFLAGICNACGKGGLRQSASEAPAKLTVGAAKMNITPPAGMFPFHSEHEAYPYVSIHDTLYARAIVMDNGRKRAVLIELDEVQVPDPEALTQEVADAAGVTGEDVIICVSHTHSTLHPGGNDSRLQPVTDLIKRQAVAAVTTAVDKLEPAFVSFIRSEAYVNINNGEMAQSGRRYDDHAFSDKTLDIVRFCRPGGDAIALVVNYPTHAEVMFRSVSKDGGYEITGDLPGRIAQIMEGREDAPIVLTTAGAEGDQQPLFTSRQRTTAQDSFDHGAGGWTIVDILAHRLVDAIDEAIAKMPSGDDEVVLTAMSAKAVVPGQHRHRDSATGAVVDEPAADVHIPISRIRLNDIAFSSVGADIASSVGVAIRDASTVRNTMLITCAAGAVGYILPDEMYNVYTHGVFGSRVRPGYSQKAIIDAFAQIEKQQTHKMKEK